MIRRVRIYGNPILQRKSSPLEQIDSGIRRLAGDMMETMYHYNGVGLAAPQVGESLRIITVDPRDQQFGARVLINPRITSNKGEISGEEGCLSLPNIYAEIKRSEEITIIYKDLEGKEHNEIWKGFVARIAQHEIDHLNGVLFVDHLEDGQREPLREQLKTLKKHYKELEKIGPDIVDKARSI